jgi:hypothetical protein
MTSDVQTILNSFELLPDSAKQEVASVIIHRILELDSPPLSDLDFTSAADELFSELDRNESRNG